MMTSMKCRFSVLALVTGLAIFGTGCQTMPANGGGDGSGDGNANGNDGGGDGGGTISVGQAMYEANCERCHAVPGTGTGNAPDLAGASADLMAEIFNESLHQDLFPGGFSQQDFNELAAFLASF